MHCVKMHCVKLLLVALMVFKLVTGTGAQLYEWSCSPLDANNSYTLPNLGSLDHETVAGLGNRIALSDDNVDVFPVPSTLNCSGTVSALEYCYGGRRRSFTFGTDYPAFTLLTLEQKDLTFRITDMMEVYGTPARDLCSSMRFAESESASPNYLFCCDSLALNFSLPASNFAFGIIPALSQVNQIRYNVDPFPDFRVEQYSFNLSDLGTPSVGDIFTLNDTNRRIDMALRILQFIITPNQDTITHDQQETLENTTTATDTNTITESTGVLSLGFVVAIAAGGGGAVILIILITAIATSTALTRRHKKVTITETGPTETSGEHSSDSPFISSEQSQEDEIVGTIAREGSSDIHADHVSVSHNHASGVSSAKEREKNKNEHTDQIYSNSDKSGMYTLIPSTKSSVQSREDIEYDRTKVISLNWNDVHIDYVAVSSNQAYGATSIKEGEDIEYEFIDRTKGISFKHNSAYDVHTGHVSNEAYGVISAKERGETEYEYIDNTKGISSGPNKAYGVHTGHVTVSSNEAYGIIRAMEGEAEYDYTDNIPMGPHVPCEAKEE